MKKGNTFLHRIVSTGTMLALLSACFNGCGNKTDLGEIKGEPIKDIAEADAISENCVGEYYVEKQISLDSAIDAAFTQDGIALLNERDGGLEVSFLSKEDGSQLKSAEITDCAYYAGIRAGGEGVYLAYFVRDMSKCKVAYLTKDGSKTEIDGFDFGNQEYTGDIALKDVISDGTSDWLWFTTAVLASESGIEEFKDYDDGLYVVNRIYEVRDGKLQGGYIQEYEEIRASGIKYSKPAFIECGNVWNIETVNKEKGVMDKYTQDELYFLSSWTGSYDVTAKLYEDSLCYIRDGAINCYSISKKTETKTVDLFACGINPGNVRFFDVSDEGFEVITDAYYYKLALGESDKQTLVLACCGLSHSGDTSLQKAVAAFNSSNGKYIIKLKDYIGEDVDWDAAATALNLDIMSGDIPDMIAFWPQLDAAAYSSKGMLCNFYDYIDNDLSLSRDSFVPAVLRAYGYDEAIYTVSSAFYMDTLVGSESKVGAKSGLSFDEFHRIFDADGTKTGGIYGLGVSEEETLTHLCIILMDDFVDWEKGECSFDGEEFKDLLVFCKEYVDSYVYSEESLKSRIAKGEILASCQYIHNVSEFQVMKQIYGDDLVAVGYPTGDGSGSVIRYWGAHLSITESCAEKEAAWEFVKDYISHPEYIDYPVFPVLSDLLEEYLESSKTCEMEVDNETGGMVKLPNASYDDYGARYVVYEADDSDIEAVYNIINNACRKEEYHLDILAIIEEEASAYLAGGKSVDEVAKVIQSRVQLMLNE